MRYHRRAARVLTLATLVCLEPGARAGPIPTTCIRDVADDLPKIRALFEQVDRMELRTLRNANVGFYLQERGFIPLDECLLRANYRDGREDAAPFSVGPVRRLQFGGEAEQATAYVVRTIRLAWFDRGSAPNSSYTPVHDTWLVTFSDCEIRTVREVPELSYLVDGRSA